MRDLKNCYLVKTELFSDVHRTRQYCFSLSDHIRYYQNPGDLSTQVVEATPLRGFSTTWVYTDLSEF